MNIRRISLRVNAISPAESSPAWSLVEDAGRDVGWDVGWIGWLAVSTDRNAWASIARTVQRRHEVQARTWCSSRAVSSFPPANESSIFERIPATRTS